MFGLRLVGINNYYTVNKKINEYVYNGKRK